MNTIELFESSLRDSLARHTRSGVMDKIAAYHAEVGDLVDGTEEAEPTLEDRLAKTAQALHARLTGEAPAAALSVLERLRG